MNARRKFLQTTATASALATLGSLSEFRFLSPARADETKVTPEIANGELEPLVKLIFDTPREKCAEMVAEQLRGGLPYRQLLAALFIAALRNGHRHQVYVMHSVHQMSLDARTEERLLPLFWALDTFKIGMSTQKDRHFRPLKKVELAPQRAVEDLHAGLKEWDAERSERALLALAENQGPRQTMALLWHYGARDWQRAGHKAICVANSARVLETIGWQHCELVLRLVNEVLHDGDDPKNKKMGEQSYQPNRVRVARTLDRLPGDWANARGERGATLQLLAAIREGNVDGACELACEDIARGRARAGAIWDAVHLAAGELLLRCQGGLGVHPLHLNTSANALHHGFRTSGDTATRWLILLQAVGWAAEFTRVELHKKTLQDVKITEIDEGKLVKDPQEHIRASRRLVLLKARAGDPHEFKFPAATFEDCQFISPEWRPYKLVGSARLLGRYNNGAPDSAAVQQAREALRRM